MKLKLISRLGTGLLATGFIVMQTGLASAASTAITGGTNGPDCNSGGYFTPSSATITSGDTVTISVPANDPYAGGVEVHGFPQGNFTVARGGSVTTSAITANVSYYGTWPSTGCMKGTGTITVSAPVQTPPPSGGGGTTTPPTTTTPSPTPSKSTPVSSSSTKTTTPTATSTPTTPTPAATDTTTSTDQKSTPAQKAVSPAKTVGSSSASAGGGSKNVAVFSGVGVIIVSVVAFAGWRFLLRRRLSVVPVASATVTPVQPSVSLSNVSQSVAPPTPTDDVNKPQV